MKFSNDFLFGAASAAYQIEGGHDIDGKGISNWDVFSKIEGKTLNGTNGNIAIDHYHRYKEDIKLMAEMGLESYRFSISWTRIFPKDDGKINDKGIEFYNKIIDECLHYGIVPFVTLYHWDLPQYLEDIGGWSNQIIISEFLKYANTCFEYFGDRVKHWITFNESVYFLRFGYITGAHPPGLKNEQELYFKALHHVMMANAKTVISYKNLKQFGEIGFSHGYSPNYPATSSQDDLLAANHANCFENYMFLDPLFLGVYPAYCLDVIKKRGISFQMTEEDQHVLLKASVCIDFLGLNYYHPNAVKKVNNIDEVDIDYSREASTGQKRQYYYDGFYEIVKPKEKEYTKWGWEVSPEALLNGIQTLRNRYDSQIKIYITENGLGDKDIIIDNEIVDIPRIKYIEKHLMAVKEGNRRGYNIKGYFAWSMIDLLSWLNGFEKQYGFIYVDHKNHLQRKKKASFYWYQNVIKTRGEKIKEEIKYE